MWLLSGSCQPPEVHRSPHLGLTVSSVCPQSTAKLIWLWSILLQAEKEKPSCTLPSLGRSAAYRVANQSLDDSDLPNNLGAPNIQEVKLSTVFSLTNPKTGSLLKGSFLLPGEWRRNPWKPISSCFRQRECFTRVDFCPCKHSSPLLYALQQSVSDHGSGTQIQVTSNTVPVW